MPVVLLPGLVCISSFLVLLILTCYQPKQYSGCQERREQSHRSGFKFSIAGYLTTRRVERQVNESPENDPDRSDVNFKFLADGDIRSPCEWLILFLNYTLASLTLHTMMSHSFYRYGIFFSVLASLSGLFQTFFIFRIGSQTYMLPSFTGWFVSGSIIALIGAGILIRYYDKKDYTLAYSTAVISTAATVILHLIIYNMLRSREPSGFYIPVYLLTLAASMVYAAVLVFSDAGKRPWLRVAGVWFFLVLATVFSLIIWATFFGSMQATPWSEAVNKWASLAGSLIPLLFAVNFVTELRTAVREDAPALRSRLQQLGVALLIVVAVVTVAINFGKEAIRGLAAIPVVVTPAERQIAEPFEARVYVNADGDTLRYRFMRPLDYDPQKE